MLSKKPSGGGQLRAVRMADHSPFKPYVMGFLQACRVQGFTERTVETRLRALERFILWCGERDLQRPQEITPPVVERYQRHLYHYRQVNGAPLSFISQRSLLSSLKMFFQWAARERHLLYNPASELRLPRVPKRLPQHLFSVSDVNRILNQADVNTPSGLRDRAIMEVLYSSGVRRMELVQLTIYDIDTRQGELAVRNGKGNRDRIVPLGERACAWVNRYLEEVRPLLLTAHDDGVCFLTDYGDPFIKSRLGERVKAYIDRAGLKVIGSCHLFRHAMATHMLENGADIRYIQAILGHASLSTTAVYTHVSIRQLKAIHAATHPARAKRVAKAEQVTEMTVLDDRAEHEEVACSAEALLTALDAEDEEDAL